MKGRFEKVVLSQCVDAITIIPLTILEETLEKAVKKQKKPSATETPESTKTLAVVLLCHFGKVNKKSQT